MPGYDLDDEEAVQALEGDGAVGTALPRMAGRHVVMSAGCPWTVITICPLTVTPDWLLSREAVTLGSTAQSGGCHGLRLARELRYLKLPADQTGSAPDGLFSLELFGTAHWTNAPRSTSSTEPPNDTRPLLRSA